MYRNYLLKHVFGRKIEERIKTIGRRGRRRKQPLDNLNEMSGYCEVKEEALDRTVWRTCSERGSGLVVRKRLNY